MAHHHPRNHRKPARDARPILAVASAAACIVSGLSVGLLSPTVAGAATAANHAQLAQARKALLALNDMPSGWTKGKAPDNNSTVGDAQLARCIGVAKALITENPPSADSPEFRDRQGTLTVDDNVSVFPSAKNATRELDTVANPKTPGCMTALASGPLKSKLLGKTPKGVRFGTPLVSAIDPTTYGTGTTGYSLSMPVTTHGVTLNLTVTDVFAVRGRLGHQITFTSVGVPFPISLEQRLTTVAVGRL